MRSRGCGRGNGGSRGTLGDTLRLRVALPGSDPRSNWHHPPNQGGRGRAVPNGSCLGKIKALGMGSGIGNEPCRRSKAS